MTPLERTLKLKAELQEKKDQLYKIQGVKLLERIVYVLKSYVTNDHIFKTLYFDKFSRRPIISYYTDGSNTYELSDGGIRVLQAL